MASRRLVTMIGVALAVIGGAMLVGYALAGEVGFLGVVAYLVCVLAPGVALYGVLAGRFRSEPSNLLEAVFFANLLGLAMVEGIGWVLARSGLFSLAALLVLELLVVALPAVGFRRALLARFRATSVPLLSVAGDEAVFLGVVVALAGLLVLPLLVLFSNGFFVGADTAPYTQAGWLVATTGRWPSLTWIWWPGASQATVAPGAPIVYATFISVTRTFLPPMATVIAIVPLALTPIGLCLLVRRFTAHPLLTYGLPLVWLVSTNGTTAFLYNNTLANIYSGTHPDATLGLPFLVAVFVLLTDLARGKSGLWFETGLLSGATVGSILATQLNFIFVVAALLFFGLGIVRARGWRFSLLRLGLVVLPTVVAWPYYLVPSEVASTSSGFSGGSIWRTSVWLINWSNAVGSTGLLAWICTAIVAFTLAAALYERVRRRPIGAALTSSTGIFAFSGLAALALYIAYSNVATDVIVIASTRFLPFASLALVPVLGFGCDRLIHLTTNPEPAGTATPRPRANANVAPVVVAVAIAALLLYAGATSDTSNNQLASNATNPGSLVTPSLLAASSWLKENAPAKAIIAIDANGGNNGAMSSLGAFSDHVSVKRLRSDLYNTLHLPPPQNTSFYLVNLVMTDPSAANAAAAAAYGIDYYVYQVGFSSPQISVFSMLPYFSLVYANTQVDVFEYVGGTGVGFVPAVAYCSAGSGIVTGYSHHAFGYAFSIPALPAVPNWITSVTNYTMGSLSATYCLNVATAGNYTLYVHRDVYATSQFVDISVGRTSVGQVYYLSTGSTIGTPLTFSLLAGPVELTLSFLGGVGGAMGPVDYLVLTPAAPLGTASGVGT